MRSQRQISLWIQLMERQAASNHVNHLISHQLTHVTMSKQLLSTLARRRPLPGEQYTDRSARHTPAATVRTCLAFSQVGETNASVNGVECDDSDTKASVHKQVSYRTIRICTANNWWRADVKIKTTNCVYKLDRKLNRSRTIVRGELDSVNIQDSCFSILPRGSKSRWKRPTDIGLGTQLLCVNVVWYSTTHVSLHWHICIRFVQASCQRNWYKMLQMSPWATKRSWTFSTQLISCEQLIDEPAAVKLQQDCCTSARWNEWFCRLLCSSYSITFQRYYELRWF